MKEPLKTFHTVKVIHTLICLAFSPQPHPPTSRRDPLLVPSANLRSNDDVTTSPSAAHVPPDIPLFYIFLSCQVEPHCSPFAGLQSPPTCAHSHTRTHTLCFLSPHISSPIINRVRRLSLCLSLFPSIPLYSLFAAQEQSILFKETPEK